MTSSSRTRTTKAHCRASAVVGAAELLGLAPFADLACPAGGRLGCELAAGHDGSHVALVATAQGGDQWWWLQWDGQFSEVVEIELCQAQLQQGRYADDCFLPEDHPGRHSFDVPPPPPAGRRHPVRPHPPGP